MQGMYHFYLAYKLLLMHLHWLLDMALRSAANLAGLKVGEESLALCDRANGLECVVYLFHAHISSLNSTHTESITTRNAKPRHSIIERKRLFANLRAFRDDSFDSNHPLDYPSSPLFMTRGIPVSVFPTHHVEVLSTERLGAL
jgi:hypothetical protein